MNMKYMVICIGAEPLAMFFDEYQKARNAKTDVECGLGGYAEIYVRELNEEGFEEYVFLEA